ncbi:universal stress protein [Seonamhaeicola algicola]|uniref:Universal stress protein n=1 Tax=Seonamhaeicola algicola TaxID=1719036 RepID=A0A5C7AU37_9FLAO|nr:universal stress protein [Seonamhaeicola algicola]TXE10005.1 universal stress protein [Seonamhaeicola algicola]
MEKIIVPVDFSEYSEYALKAAAKLAEKNNAEILALHMLEMPEIMLTSSGEEPQRVIYFLKLAEQKFETFLNKNYLQKVKVTPIVKHFKVFSEVNEVAKEHGADLIVMGSHGVSGAKEFFVGSNTERVVRNADVPVLVIKNDIADVNFDVVVLACNFSEECVASYIKASKICAEMNAKLYLVHVNLPNDGFNSSVEIEKQVVNFFTKAERSLDKMEDVHYVNDYTVEDGIINSANKLGADLIIMPTHGRKGLAHFFQGSISEDVANHSTLPVMTFKL